MEGCVKCHGIEILRSKIFKQCCSPGFICSELHTSAWERVAPAEKKRHAKWTEFVERQKIPYLPGKAALCWIDVHSLQHTSREFCLKTWHVLCFVRWPGSLHILILPVLFPLSPSPGMPHSHNSLQHGLAVKFWKISWTVKDSCLL